MVVVVVVIVVNKGPKSMLLIKKSSRHLFGPFFLLVIRWVMVDNKWWRKLKMLVKKNARAFFCVHRPLGAVVMVAVVANK
jgi:archaellum biogenesis protein FlaJ (TadC family)